MQYSEVMKIDFETIGVGLMYWLMLQVPTTRHSFSAVVIPVAIPQASMSKSPPATGVPTLSPVSSAAALVTCPQISADCRRGGSFPEYSSIP